MAPDPVPADPTPEAAADPVDAYAYGGGDESSPSPAEAADMISAVEDAETTAAARRVVEMARAEAEAAIIRARAAAEVAKILPAASEAGETGDVDDQDDDETGPDDGPGPDPVPRSRHWLLRRIGGRR